MKVVIGRYRDHWLSPYTIMTVVLFWKKWTDPEFDLYDDKNDHYTDWLIRPCTWLMRLLDFVHPKINYVKIDRWDTWDMYSTLSQIVLPMLKQLNATKDGAPYADEDDVPKGMGLRSTEAAPKENECDTDSNHFQRWDWILDEMIWTFTQLHPDTDWESQYHSGKHDMQWKKLETELSEMITGPKNTHVFDSEGHSAHSRRIDNGLRLFGKYFRTMWD